ncbi:MAG: hypothetical protein QXH97_00995 [Candidatus Bathyarchaeia archaeon]|nr:ArsR family transcriptional regulator [Candidatus Bathyarchaeota archaeon]
MKMFKGGYHPKAFLTRKRNVRRGLDVRSKIIAALERGSLDAKTISKRTGVKYSSILYHLHLLEAEKIAMKERRTRFWKLTGTGQRRLTECG